MERNKYIELVTTELNELSEHQRDTVCNGVGSAKWYLSWINKYIPEDIVELFTPAADWHDVAYTMGGPAVYRMYADTHFEQLVLDVAYAENNFWRRARARLWARICFDAVRTGGEFSWEYRPEPISIYDATGIK